MQISECPFCSPELEHDQTIVFENEFCRFLQQPQKILIGSGIIVPKAHKPQPFDLDNKEWEATFELLKKAKSYLDDRLKPDGYNLGWNVGGTAGQEVFHAHLHIIPRFKDEPYAGKGIRHWLKGVQNRRTPEDEPKPGL